MNDFSGQFDRIRADLRNVGGCENYRHFRMHLRPRYWLARADVLISACLFAATLTLSWCVTSAIPILFVPFAVLIGLFLHRLSLFLHEGAHFLLASERMWNDLFTNALVGVFVLSDVRQYRFGHMNHHRHLGTSLDPERSYQTALNLRRVFWTLIGRNAIDVILRRESHASAVTRVRTRHFVPLAGLLIYGILIGAGFAGDHAWFSLSAIVGVICVFPLVATLRQTAEHRYSKATFVSVDGHPITRLFEGRIANFFFGAAGFGDHLLHHWDPGLSYTRLPELRLALLNTELGPILRERTSRYVPTIRTLWAW